MDSVQDVYDFFQRDAQLYSSSALFRLLKHVELRMNSQLRVMLTVRCQRGHCAFDDGFLALTVHGGVVNSPLSLALATLD